MERKEERKRKGRKEKIKKEERIVSPRSQNV
jgi:hypothetical protein